MQSGGWIDRRNSGLFGHKESSKLQHNRQRSQAVLKRSLRVELVYRSSRIVLPSQEKLNADASAAARAQLIQEIQTLPPGELEPRPSMQSETLVPIAGNLLQTLVG